MSCQCRAALSGVESRAVPAEPAEVPSLCVSASLRDKRFRVKIIAAFLCLTNTTHR